MDYYHTLSRFRKNILAGVGKLAQAAGVRGKAVVLCYHSIGDSPDRYTVSYTAFSQQMAALAKSCRFISLDDLITGRHSDDQRPAVAVTFDDGYRDILRIVPIARRYDIPVTVFALSQPQRADRFELDNNKSLLTPNDIRRLTRLGFKIGSHTATHGPLLRLNDYDLKKEIVKSKMDLEKISGARIDYFSYPHGRVSNRIIKIVKSAGYRAAFGVSLSVADCTDQFNISRIIVDKGYEAADFPHIFNNAVLSLQQFWSCLEKLVNKPLLQIECIGCVSRIYGVINTLLKLNNRLPTHPYKLIGPYRLKTVIPLQPSSHYVSGIYMHNKKKYFIKSWKGRHKDTAYFHLYNEYLLGSRLYNTAERVSGRTGIHISKVVDIYRRPGCLSVVFEYLESRQVSSMDLEHQARYMNQALRGLRLLSQDLSDDEKSVLMRMNIFYYLFTAIHGAICVLLIDLSQAPLLPSRIFYLFRMFLTTRPASRIIAHRDLCPRNLLVKGRSLYIVDYGSMILSAAGYDVASVMVNPLVPVFVSRSISVAAKYSLVPLIIELLLLQRGIIRAEEKLVANQANLAYAI